MALCTRTLSSETNKIRHEQGTAAAAQNKESASAVMTMEEQPTHQRQQLLQCLVFEEHAVAAAGCVTAVCPADACQLLHQANSISSVELKLCRLLLLLLLLLLVL
jgi:hypothetical protein